MTPRLPWNPPTVRDLRQEGMAMILREATRFPSGGSRIAPHTAHEIAGRMYDYLVSTKVIPPIGAKKDELEKRTANVLTRIAVALERADRQGGGYDGVADALGIDHDEVSDWGAALAVAAVNAFFAEDGQ